MNKEELKRFDEIRPYEPEEMQQAFEDLLNDRQFSLVLKGFVPWLPKGVRNGLLRLAFKGVKTPLDFQKRFMKRIVQYITKVSHLPFYRLSRIIKHCNILIDNLLTFRK
jgi:hypothetical protein